jgi:PAS domain-containing protein
VAVGTRVDGQLLAVNDRFVRLVGCPRDEPIGQTLDGLGLRRDPAQSAEPSAVLVGGEPTPDVAATIHTKSGAQRHVLVAQSDVEID